MNNFRRLMFLNLVPVIRRSESQDSSPGAQHLECGAARGLRMSEPTWVGFGDGFPSVGSNL